MCWLWTVKLNTPFWCITFHPAIKKVLQNTEKQRQLLIGWLVQSCELAGFSRLIVIGWTNNWCIRMECSTWVRRLRSWATFVVAAVCSLNQNLTPLPHLPCLAFHQDPVEYIIALTLSHVTCDCSTNLVMCCAIDQVIWLTVPQKLMKYKNHR